MTDDAPIMLARLRSTHEGILAFGERVGDVVERCKFVIDAATGQPVLPVPAEALRSDEVMLYTPDDGLDNPECLQVHAVCSEFDPRQDAAADQWLAYHLRPTHARWARLTVQSLKRLDDVIDGDLVRLANPLRTQQGALCKWANQQPDALARACEVALKVRPEQPLLVGVDPWGCDVRSRFGVLRLVFAQPVSTAEEARVALLQLLER